MPKGGSSSRGRGGKAAGGAAKRKRDASDAESMTGIQKRRTNAQSDKEEGEKWTKQYLQGVGILDPKLHSLGCGWCRLGTPRVPFQAPFTCDGRIEVMSGTDGPQSGSIRLCGPQNYWAHDIEGISDAIFLIPFRHIEQVFIAMNFSFTEEEAYEVIIVPTGATGASSVKREYPQIISFKWPDKPADEGLSGKDAENFADKDTYLSVLKQVFDKQLEPFDKAVIDVTATPKTMMGNIAFLSPPTESHMKSKAVGHLHFLDQGILFKSDTQRVYMPFPSLDSVMVIRAKEEKDKIVGLNVICRAKEPFYDGTEGASSETTLINFGQMNHSIMEDIKGYLKKHDIKVMLCEQMFYDYENNVPATGWMPLMG